jgi:hypothetical protein
MAAISTPPPTPAPIPALAPVLRPMLPPPPPPFLPLPAAAADVVAGSLLDVAVVRTSPEFCVGLSVTSASFVIVEVTLIVVSALGAEVKVLVIVYVNVLVGVLYTVLVYTLPAVRNSVTTIHDVVVELLISRRSQARACFTADVVVRGGRGVGCLFVDIGVAMGGAVEAGS